MKLADKEFKLNDIVELGFINKKDGIYSILFIYNNIFQYIS